MTCCLVSAYRMFVPCDANLCLTNRFTCEELGVMPVHFALHFGLSMSVLFLVGGLSSVCFRRFLYRYSS